MEASKRMICAMVMMVLLLVESAQASCTIKNSSSNDIELLPVGYANVKIKVKVGAVVTIAPIYLNVVIKNLGTGIQSKPTKLTDGTVLVCVDGIIKGTVSIYLGSLVNGLISILANLIILVTV